MGLMGIGGVRPAVAAVTEGAAPIRRARTAAAMKLLFDPPGSWQVALGPS